jgi:hypothetical protein
MILNSGVAVVALLIASRGVLGWHKKTGTALALLPSAATVRFHGKRRVKMHPLVSTAFAFLTGLTACGLVGTTMELACGRRLAFAEPYIAPGHVARSLAAAAFAGPFMLVNDALAARRERRISRLALLSCLCTSVLWALALGVSLTGAVFALLESRY